MTSSRPLTIGILETGRSREALAEHGSYIDMFRQLFADVAPNLSFQVFAVLDGVFPDSVADCDGWLVTGSRHGVYENLPWMIRLKEFLRQAVEDDRPVVGICFGHQILAEALGGKVNKSYRGWGVALHRYAVNETRPWMGEDAQDLTLNAMHQDQVEALPEDGKMVEGLSTHVLAGSDFCPYAALTYRKGDDKDIAVSFQAHPEFGIAYEKALLGVLSGNAIPQEQAEAAIHSLEKGTQIPEQRRVAQWLTKFFEHAAP